MNRFFEVFADVFAALVKDLGRVVAAFATSLSVFPTSLANAIAPLLGASIGVERRPHPHGDFERRIGEITQQLQQSGSDAQTLLDELGEVMEARRQQFFDAQARLLQMQMAESELQERVAALSAVKPEAAVAINALLDESLEARDRRGARRDWLIFGMGVLATAIVSLVFYLLTV